MSGLVNLSSLVLRGSDVSDEDLLAIGTSLISLRELQLRECEHVTDEGIVGVLL